MISLWHGTGWSLDRSKATPVVVFDITKVLENVRAPPSDVKMGAAHRLANDDHRSRRRQRQGCRQRSKKARQTLKEFQAYTLPKF